MKKKQQLLLVTGGVGYVGSTFMRDALSEGYNIRCLDLLLYGGKSIIGLMNHPDFELKVGDVRNKKDVEDALEGVDAVVHLAGDNLADGQWNDRKKNSILSSRVNGTKLLSKYFVASGHKPSVIVSASAVGFYGDRGEDRVDETSEPGKGFLADVCKQWEEAAASAVDAGVRVVN